VRHDGAVQRVSVVGSSGAGKTSLARRLAAAIDAPFVELDGIHHRENWVPVAPDDLASRVDEITATARWVIDGNYRAVVADGPVWRRADTVVWLDPPRRTVMRQVTARTLRRLARREILWNGNRETWRNLCVWDPDSIIHWSWSHRGDYQDQYSSAMVSPALSHLAFVHLRSRDEVERWLVGAGRGARPAPG